MFFEKFFGRVLGVVGRDIFVSIINFFVTSYLANTLGVDGFGYWVAVLTLLAVLDLLFRLKLDQLIIFYVHVYGASIALYMRICRLSGYGLLLGAMVVFVLGGQIITTFELSGSLAVVAIYVSFSLSVFGNLCFYIFLAEGRYRAYNFLVVMQALTFAIFILITYRLFDPSVFLALVAQIVSWGAVVLLFFAHSVFLVPKPSRASGLGLNLTDNEILKKGSFNFLASALAAGVQQFPRLFSLSLIGTAYLGYLGLAQLIIGLISRLPLALNTVLYPMLTKEGDLAVTRVISVIRVLSAVFLPVITVLVVSIPFLISFFYGADYLRAALYVQILLPFAYLGMPGVVLGSYYSSQGNFRILFIVNSAAIILALLAAMIVSVWSLEYAPIIALCVSFLTTTLVSISYLPQTVTVSDFVPRLNDFSAVLNFLLVRYSPNRD